MQHTDQNKRIYSDGKCMIQITNVENFSQKIFSNDRKVSSC